MKYLEQRVEELEKEILKLKAKIISFERKQERQCNNNINDTSKYLNNYASSPSVNLMSEPDLETAFPSSFDKFDIEKNSLNTSVVNTKKINEALCPPYPKIVGSWDKYPAGRDKADSVNPGYVDSFDIPFYYPPANPVDVPFYHPPAEQGDVLQENTDEYGFKLNYDKMDKDFLEWMKNKDKETECSGKCSCKHRHA